jgi:hypothetical protein
MNSKVGLEFSPEHRAFPVTSVDSVLCVQKVGLACDIALETCAPSVSSTDYILISNYILMSQSIRVMTSY